MSSTVSAADTAWVLVSTALVFLMIPGLGYFYSGMSRGKNALSLIFLSLLAIAVSSLEWFLWGFSLSLSPTGGPFIGDLSFAGFTGMADAVHPAAPTVPIAVYAIYQCMFAAITPSLIIGSSAERSRIVPTLAFLFLWSTVVYAPIAYWTWAPNGWLHTLGALDYAGGLPVHMASGFAALAKSLVIGKRVGYGVEEFKPHSYTNIMLGTSLLWFGWFGFNAGSATAANARTGMAMVATHMAACAGGLAWAFIAYWRHPERKISSFHFCCGVVAGLVAITPASGFVPPWASLIIGGLGGAVCHYAVELKNALCYDDALDVFAVHGVGGLLGNLLTGVFAQQSIAALDGSTIPGGVVDGHWMQLVYQIVSIATGGLWSFAWTLAMVWGMQRIPLLRLRLTEEDEVMGMDASQMGENGYEHFVEDLKRQTTIETRGDVEVAVLRV
jgi:Amt family ammonium transporter